MHLVACIKLIHPLRIEFQMYVMNRSFAYIMVRNLDFHFLKIFNQSEDRNRSRRKGKGGANLSEAQTNIGNGAIEKHDRKFTWLLLIVSDGKYVLYFNNTSGVC